MRNPPAAMPRNQAVTRSRPKPRSGQAGLSLLRHPDPYGSPYQERFPFTVSSLDELVPNVSTPLAERLERGEAIQQIIVAPRQSVLGTRHTFWSWLNALLPWQWTPNWVLVLTGPRLLVAAVKEPTAVPAIAVTPVSEILSLEMGTILLFSWFEWTRAQIGRTERTRIYFNTVGDRYFREMLTALQRTLIAQAGLPAPQADRRLELLRGLPFKFMNLIAHRLLLPDEQVQAVVYQPTIWTRGARLFRRQRAAALTLVLSNYHVLIAQEDLTRSGVGYGLITRFCPRGRVRRATLEQGQDDLWLNLTLEVQGVEETLRVLFDGAAKQALDDLIAQLP